jgi:hypothetical protein
MKFIGSSQNKLRLEIVFVNILDQKDKNQMKLIWHILNSFGNNKAKRVILWIQNCIFKNNLNLE